MFTHFFDIFYDYGFSVTSCINCADWLSKGLPSHARDYLRSLAINRGTHD